MAFRVTLNDTDTQFEVNPGEPLLDAAERAGLALVHDCRFGGCGTCRIKVKQGSVDYEEQPFGLTEEEAGQGYALACQARACSDLHIDARLRPAGFIQPDYHEATIERMDALCHDVTHLVLRIPTATDVAYHPGQYLNVILEDGTPRSFSMASPPRGDLYDLHIRRVPGGRFTERLYGHYRVGDTLDVELPLGEFRLQDDSLDNRLLMVAGGTGLAPIKSIIESLDELEHPPEVLLYWGVRKERDLYLHDDIQSWLDRRPNLTYVPVLSDADDDWSGRRGYVHEAICEDHTDLSGFDAYLCGPPPMIFSARDAFTRLGMDGDRIYSDSFNFTHELAEAE